MQEKVSGGRVMQYRLQRKGRTYVEYKCRLQCSPTHWKVNTKIMKCSLSKVVICIQTIRDKRECMATKCKVFGIHVAQ